ncbi:MAG: hypothetical protein Q9207_003868 [Kuettlingeria erythrocarpa]
MPDGSWKHEGPEEMMVSSDSAKGFYPREKLIACDTDHSHIARIKRGENSIYTLIRAAIKQAMLSVGDLYTEIDGHRNIPPPIHQASEPENPDYDWGNLVRPPSVPLESRSYASVGRQQQPEQDYHHDQEDNQKLRDATGKTHQLPSDTVIRENEQSTNPQTQNTRDIDHEAPATDNQHTTFERRTTGTKSTFFDDQLKDAISKGDVQGTKDLVATLFDVDCKDEIGMTPLHAAAELRDEPLVKLLLELGAHRRAKTKKGDTTLHILSSVKVGQFPLTESLIELLLQHRPLLEEVNELGRTPLMLAARQSEHLLATKLISSGASIHRTDEWEATALHYAALGAKGPEVITLLVVEGALVGAKDFDGRTPLHYALDNETDAVEAVNCLLQAGADKDATTYADWTPLHRAAGNGKVGCVELLLSSGANIEAKTTTGSTPLHIAACNGQPRCSELLLSSGANIEAETDSKETPLILAARKGDARCLELLLFFGANTEAKMDSGFTPLLIVARDGHSHSVEILLTSGANIESKSIQNVRPLCIAAQQGHARCVELLLNSGANTEAENQELGKTSLHCAVEVGNVQIIKMLLAHGANPLARSRARAGGLTPRSTPVDGGQATEEQKQEIRRVLKEAEKEWKHSGKKYTKLRWALTLD